MADSADLHILVVAVTKKNGIFSKWRAFAPPSPSPPCFQRDTPLAAFTEKIFLTRERDEHERRSASLARAALSECRSQMMKDDRIHKLIQSAI